MKKLQTSLWILAFWALLGGAALAETVTDAGNVSCPVSGRPVTSKLTAVYEGKRYAFCCKGCLEKFEKDPKKYITEKASLETRHTHPHHEH